MAKIIAVTEHFRAQPKGSFGKSQLLGNDIDSDTFRVQIKTWPETQIFYAEVRSGYWKCILPEWIRIIDDR